jgi:hypothetical protein
MSQRRRSTKAMTRLETLEGRITPTVTLSDQVLGPQILVLMDSGTLSQTGWTRGEKLALRKFEHINNPGKAESFLNNHLRLKALLEQDAANAGGVTTTTIQATAATSNNAPTTNQAATGSTNQGGTSSTTTTSDSGTTSQGGTQNPGSVPSGNTGSPGPTGFAGSDSSLPDNLGPNLPQIYTTYETHGMAGVLSEFPNLKKSFSGDSVDVSVHGTGTPFTLKGLDSNPLEAEVTGLDSKIQVIDPPTPTDQWVDAWVPIADLPSLARLSLVQSVWLAGQYTTK